MDAGINNVTYMELNSGPKMAKSTCGKMIVLGTIDRGSILQLNESFNNSVVRSIVVTSVMKYMFVTIVVRYIVTTVV